MLEPLDDERVRRALAHGLDREPLLVAGAEPAHGGFLPPSMPGHSHDLALPLDLNRARALLSEAGFADGRGLPELELVHPDFGFSAEFRREMEARWRSPWPELGVRVRHRWLGAATIYEGVGRSHLAVWGWNADYPDPDGMLGNFIGVMSTVHGHLGMDDVARARTNRSRDDRLRSYREIDRQLVAERVEAVPMSYDTWFLVHRPWIDGFWATPTQLGSLEEVVVRRPA
jgi:oligopeptide transport system substrate-binding protein